MFHLCGYSRGYSPPTINGEQQFLTPRRCLTPLRFLEKSEGACFTVIVLPSVLIQLLIIFTIFLCTKIAQDLDEVPTRILRVGRQLLRMGCYWCLIFFVYNLMSLASTPFGTDDIGFMPTTQLLFPLLWCIVSVICFQLITPLRRSLARRLC